MDNLSAHKGADIRRWAVRHKVDVLHPGLRLVGQPDGGPLGPLRQFTIANSQHANHTVQTRTLHAFLYWRNANARHRDVLAAKRKERARVQSERGHPLGRTPPQNRSLNKPGELRGRSASRTDRPCGHSRKVSEQAVGQVRG